jgi:hypothetical protein
LAIQLDLLFQSRFSVHEETMLAPQSIVDTTRVRTRLLPLPPGEGRGEGPAK